MPARLWKKGESGNPGGRPKGLQWFKSHTKEAQEKLLELMRSKNEKISIQATALVLAYSLGKPTEHVEHTGTLSLESVLGETHT